MITTFGLFHRRRAFGTILDTTLLLVTLECSIPPRSEVLVIRAGHDAVSHVACSAGGFETFGARVCASSDACTIYVATIWCGTVAEALWMATNV
jgi:hypothetical protein